MIARKEVHRAPDLLQVVETSTDDARGHLPVLEHVTAHQDELGVVRGGQLTDASDGLLTRCCVPRLGITLEEVSGHAELPVRGVDEGHLLRRQRQRQSCTHG